jgi:hypothetical protein
VLFQYTGGDYQLGYWMNGTNEWRGQGLAKPAEWEVLGSYDMNSNGCVEGMPSQKADIIAIFREKPFAFPGKRLIFVKRRINAAALSL